MTERSIAVIGGGITGLTAAYRLRRDAPDDVDVHLYEASERLGGCIRGTDLDGVLDESIDVGAEAALARRPEAVDLARELGLTTEAPGSARSAIFSRGELHPIPGGSVMGVPADPETAAGLLDDDEVRRAARETVTGAVSGDIAVADFIEARLGPEWPTDSSIRCWPVCTPAIHGCSHCAPRSRRYGRPPVTARRCASSCAARFRGPRGKRRPIGVRRPSS